LAAFELIQNRFGCSNAIALLRVYEAVFGHVFSGKIGVCLQSRRAAYAIVGYKKVGVDE